MQLWYGAAPSAPPAAALAAYEGCAEAGRAPPPLPPWAAPGAPPRAGPPGSSSSSSPCRAPAPSPDTCLRLLQLAARGARAGDGAALAALAAPAGLTPDPLDGFSAWALALAARVGSGSPPAPADEDGDESAMAAVERALHASASAALEAVGSPEWAALPLLFLPGPAARAGALRALLSRHAPRWAADPASRDVLTGDLRLPPSWIAAALAEWAASARRAGDGSASAAIMSALGAPPSPSPGLGAEFSARLAARDWAGAAHLLASQYGPTLLAEKGSAGRAALRAALAALAPYAAAVDAAAGAGAWRGGAGLFESFLACESIGGGDVDAVQALADALAAATAAAPAGGAAGPGGPPAAAVRRAALGDVSAAAAGWLLSAGEGAAALDLPALPADARVGLVSAAAAALAEATAA